MAVTLGKRKRPANPASGDREAGEGRTGFDEGPRPEDVFRRLFEARFRPLATGNPSEGEGLEEEGDEEDAEEWTGFSDEADEEDDEDEDADADEDGVEVIEYDGNVVGAVDRIGRREARVFMSSKPPSSNPASTGAVPVSAKRNATSAVEDEEQEEEEKKEEAENLKNDIALKRLLAESHLLDPIAGGGVRDLNPTGKNRHKALDLRIQALGSATSIYKQEKMPMHHRKGIVRKAQSREEKRRKEAKEAGIVLEKRKVAKTETKRRERVVGGPAVGKFRGGMLMLSKKDVASIDERNVGVGNRGVRKMR